MRSGLRTFVSALALATGIAVTSLSAPAMGGDNLNKRMKAVANRREELRAAAAHVGELLFGLGVQLLERVVVGVVQLVQPLRDELVRVQVERAHLLQEIIDDLEADGGAYAKKTLYYQLKANDALLAAILKHRQAQ